MAWGNEKGNTKKQKEYRPWMGDRTVPTGTEQIESQRNLAGIGYLARTYLPYMCILSRITSTGCLAFLVR